MSTMLRIGPNDHGRPMSYEEFLAGDYEEGYKYELIDGSLYVSPQPDFPHDVIVQHLAESLILYKRQHPHIVKRVSSGARVFVKGRSKTTCPEPDFAVYNACPKGRHIDWRNISPLIVVEIVSESDPEKDYQRNVELYQQVPSILEYWLFDKCEDDNGPTMRVYRRDAGDQPWIIQDFGPNETYSKALLPGFDLPVLPPEA